MDLVHKYDDKTYDTEDNAYMMLIYFIEHGADISRCPDHTVLHSMAKRISVTNTGWQHPFWTV